MDLALVLDGLVALGVLLIFDFRVDGVRENKRADVNIIELLNFRYEKIFKKVEFSKQASILYYKTSINKVAKLSEINIVKSALKLSTHTHI